MTFQQLLNGAEVLSQTGNPGVSGVEYDSRRVQPGDVFVAMRGESSDGNKYIDKAIAAGGAAVFTGLSPKAPRPRGGGGPPRLSRIRPQSSHAQAWDGHWYHMGGERWLV